MSQQPASILIRLPNWLGDVVMATGFLSLLQKAYPQSQIDVIIKKELEGIVPHLPAISKHYTFSKKDHPGLNGLYRFGKGIKEQGKYDLFFTLPDSFSSAFLGYCTGARKRIGFKTEWRGFLLTHAMQKPRSLHRVLEYAGLLPGVSATTAVQLKVNPIHLPAYWPTGKYLVLNINSEASSRRLPIQKGTELLQQLLDSQPYAVVLTGSEKESAYVIQLLSTIRSQERIYNLAGKTSISELIYLLHHAAAVVSTDSGIAHVANAVQTKVVVLFGAGDEKKTAPFNQRNLQVVRNKNVDCTACVSNTCRYGSPKCLMEMDTKTILNLLSDQMVE